MSYACNIHTGSPRVYLIHLSTHIHTQTCTRTCTHTHKRFLSCTRVGSDKTIQPVALCRDMGGGEREKKRSVFLLVSPSLFPPSLSQLSVPPLSA